MTVKELCDRGADVDRIISQLNKALEDFGGTLSAIPTDGKLSKETRAKLTSANYAVCTTAHEAIKLLREYSSLIDGIMRNTQLTWPPICAPKDS